MSGYYPYLLCGLPDLHFGMDLESFSYDEIRNQVFELLAPSDRTKVRLFLSFRDHMDLAERYLSLGDDEDLRKEYRASDPDMPSYQARFFSCSLSMLVNGEEDQPVNKEKGELLRALKGRLDRDFYAEVLKSRNAFMRKWFDFDLVLRNTLVAFAARMQHRSPEREFVYPYGKVSGLRDASEPEIITWIKENLHEGDFGLKLRLLYADELFAALELDDVYERERRVDLFRWKMAEEMVLEKDFQLDAVLAYLVRAGILGRWKELDREKGLALLQQTVSRMRQVSFGEEEQGKKQSR